MVKQCVPHDHCAVAVSRWALRLNKAFIHDYVMYCRATGVSEEALLRKCVLEPNRGEVP